MKNIKLIAAAALALLAAPGCGTSKVSTIPGMDMSAKLRRSDYVILGTATGEACATENCFFGSCSRTASVAGEELLDGRSESVSLRDARTAALDLGPLGALLDVGGAPGQSKNVAKSIAMYKAIESVPNADAMISPRYDVTTSEDSIPFNIKRTVKSCVKVRGKAIQIKSDADIAAGK